MEGNSTVFYEEVDGGIEETTIESRNNSHNVTFNSNSNSDRKDSNLGLDLEVEESYIEKRHKKQPPKKSIIVDIKTADEEVTFEPVSVKIHKPAPIEPPMPQSPFPVRTRKMSARDFTAPFISIIVSDPLRIEAEDNSGHRTDYLVTLEANLPELPHEYIQIRRRYTHFREFYNKAVKLVGKEALPDFPEKNFFGRYKAEVVQKRLIKFQELMGVVAEDPMLRSSQAFMDFLGIKKK